MMFKLWGQCYGGVKGDWGWEFQKTQTSLVIKKSYMIWCMYVKFCGEISVYGQFSLPSNFTGLLLPGTSYRSFYSILLYLQCFPVVSPTPTSTWWSGVTASCRLTGLWYIRVRCNGSFRPSRTSSVLSMSGSVLSHPPCHFRWLQMRNTKHPPYDNFSAFSLRTVDASRTDQPRWSSRDDD